MDRADYHFGMFTAMKEELEATQLADTEFRPAPVERLHESSHRRC
jgi:hypothetical protein